MRQTFKQYPRALWLLLGVFFVNRAAASLIWPFLSLYMRESLHAPLTVVTTLISIQAVAGLLATSVIGSVMDRFGRKKAMAFGVIAWSLVLLAMSAAHELWQWAFLLILYGIFQPAFYVGAFAMVADLVQPEERTGAYALARTASNLAIAIGPAAGSVFIVATHIPSFHVAAALNLLLIIPFGLFVIETMPETRESEHPSGGYRHMLHNRPFVTFFVAYLTLEFAISLVFTLLVVYVKENFGIPQEQYSLLLSINAGMIVLFQVIVARLTARYRPLPMLALGALFYLVGLIGFALSSALPHFALSMAVMTIGELIVAPTSASLVANLAPVDMRARYMGIFSVAYTIASGFGPVMGGFLSDHIAPVAIWYGGAFCAGVALLGFSFLQRQSVRRSAVENQPAFET